jgi:hypothetical protein
VCGALHAFVAERIIITYAITSLKHQLTYNILPFLPFRMDKVRFIDITMHNCR